MHGVRRQRPIGLCRHIGNGQNAVPFSSYLHLHSDGNLLPVRFFYIAHKRSVFHNNGRFDHRVQMPKNPPDTHTRQQKHHCPHDHPHAGSCNLYIIIQLLRGRDPFHTLLPVNLFFHISLLLISSKGTLPYSISPSGIP